MKPLKHLVHLYTSASLSVWVKLSAQAHFDSLQLMSDVNIFTDRTMIDTLCVFVLHVCVCVWARHSFMWQGQKIPYRGWFSPSTTLVLGIKPRSLDSVASTSACWATLVALVCYFLTCVGFNSKQMSWICLYLCVKYEHILEKWRFHLEVELSFGTVGWLSHWVTGKNLAMFAGHAWPYFCHVFARCRS